MQVEDGQKTRLAHPTQHAVEQRPAFTLDRAVIVHEQAIVQRDAHGVEAGRLDEPDVGLGDVAVAELLPEGLGALGPQQAVESGKNLARRLGDLELEHVALGRQPVAEVDALDLKGAAIRRDEALALNARQRLGAGGHGEAEQAQQGEQEAHG